MYVKENRITKGGTYVLCFILALLFVRNFKATNMHVYDGIYFSVKKIIPALFPYMIITDFLVKTGSISFVCAPLCAFFKKANITAEAAAPCITGLLCGAPVSARTVKELYESGRLTSEESDALLCAANPTSPAFIICAVGCGMLGSVRIGVIIWSFSFLISFLCALFFLPKKSQKEIPIRASESSKHNTLEALNLSIKDAAVSVINISSVVVFFYTLSHTLSDIMAEFELSGSIIAFVCGLFEIGVGCDMSTCSPYLQKELCAFIVGFGGISVLMQVKCEAHGNAKLSKYLVSKLLCGLLCSLFVFLLL